MTTIKTSNTRGLHQKFPPRSGTNVHKSVGIRPIHTRMFPSTLKTILTIFISSILVISLLFIAIFLAYFLVYGHIYPGIHVGNTQLVGLSTYEAAVRIHKDWNLDRQIAVGYVKDGVVKTWNVSPASLGLEVDAMKTALDAYTLGHNAQLVDSLGSFLHSLSNGQSVSPRINFDPQASVEGLNMLADLIHVSPQNTTLVVDQNGISVTPSLPGYTLDIQATVSKIALDPQKIILEGFLPLVTKTLEPDIQDTDSARQEVERLIDLSIPVTAYDPIQDTYENWSIGREQFLSWIKIAEIGNNLQVDLDPNQVNDFLSTLSGGLGSDRMLDVRDDLTTIVIKLKQGSPLSFTIRYLPTTYIVQPGDTYLKIGWQVGMPYWRITNANQEITEDNLKPGQTLVIPSKSDLLPLPVIWNKRIIISISQQRLWTYQDGQIRSEDIISTGIDRSPTQPGIFQVQTHEISAYASVWDLTMPNFLGIYEAWPGFMNGIHGLPTLSNGQRLWANILGRPASYGCIILDLPSAEALYNWAENGVVVEIKP
jgi:lipoprotein-anchoring transpeptidase ErfK/SrfK